MISLMQARTMRGLVGLAPWLVIAGLVWVAMFITPEVDSPALEQPLVERRDMFFDGAARDRHLFIVGQNGALLSSTDAGRHWQREELPAPGHLQSIAVSPEGFQVVVGNHGQVWTRAPHGRWQTQQLPVPEEAGKLLDVRHLHGQFWVVGEMGVLFRSDDNGMDWESLGDDEDISFNRIQSGVDGDLWIAAEFGRLLRSRDQGASWSTQSLGAESLRGLVFNGHTGVAVGNRGGVYLSLDAGGYWQAVPAFTGEHLFDVTYFDGQWWVTGDRGVLFRSRDPESGWESVTPDGLDKGYHTRLLPSASGLVVIGQQFGLLDEHRLHLWPSPATSAEWQP